MAILLAILDIFLSLSYWLGKLDGLDLENCPIKEFDAMPIYEIMPSPGAMGTVGTPLQPSGTVVVSGVTYAARSTGGFIDADDHVEVLGNENGLLLVEPESNGAILDDT